MDHLYSIMNFVEKKYNDTSEISYLQYSNLLSFRININECLIKIILKPHLMKEDFFEKSSLINDCFLAMARRQMEILKEMLSLKKT